MILDKWVLKRAFKLQSRKPKDFSHLSYAFTDSNGLKYYEFNPNEKWAYRKLGL